MFTWLRFEHVNALLLNSLGFPLTASPLLPDGKMKNSVITNSKHIGNSITKDNRDAIIENDYSNKKVVRLEEDAVSNNSLGSHKNRKLKSDSGSHKGSSESLDDGEEKKDASKEDLEDGMLLDGTLTRTLLSFVPSLKL